MSIVVHPTHTCFDDVAAWYNLNINNIDINDFLIVHGICRLVDTKKYAHAWVEQVSTVEAIDFGIVAGDKIQYSIPRSEFYLHRDMLETISYTVAEASEASRISKNSGPWDWKFFLHCNDWNQQEVPTYFGATGVFGTRSKRPTDLASSRAAARPPKPKS